MVACFLDIICHHIFKRQHAFHVHKTGTCNQVALVGIFSGKLKTDQMAAVIKIFTVNKIVLYRLPSGRFYLTDTPPFLRGHQILPNTCHRISTAVQAIQRGIVFIGSDCEITLGKRWLIIINNRIRRAGKSRNVFHRIGINRFIFLKKE